MRFFGAHGEAYCCADGHGEEDGGGGLAEEDGGESEEGDVGRHGEYDGVEYDEGEYAEDEYDEGECELYTVIS